MVVVEPSRSEQHSGERSAFLTEVAVSRGRAPSRLIKVDENGSDESVQPAEKTLAPHPPSPLSGRRTSTDAGSRRRTILNAVDGNSLTSGASAKPAGGCSIRSLIQKAAQKTILVVRTKNAMQAAESVTIRFNPAQPTDLPRSVQLPQIIDKVLDHATTRIASSSKPETTASPPFTARRHVREFRDAFQASPEVDALLKDLFWFSTSHLFQPGQHAQVEERFFARIADSFTALFVRLQMPPALQHQPNQQHQSVHARGKQTHAAARFLDVLPDIVAQVLFASIYEAFPKSRESLMSKDAQLAIRRICFGWLGGTGSSRDGGNDGAASCAHWLPVGQESPKRIAALSDFPAMRNRMLRAERVERTKLATRNRHAAAVAMATSGASGFGSPGRPAHPRYRHHHHHHQYGAHDLSGSDELLPSCGIGAAGDVIAGHAKPSPRRASKPPGPSDESNTKSESTGIASSVDFTPSDGGGAFGVRVETRERCVFEMQNSPLVASFLDRHAIGAGAGRLRVQLRLTSSSSSHTRPSLVTDATTGSGDSKESGRPSTTPTASSQMEQKALRLAPRAPRERRRRAADPAGFMLALAQIEGEGNAVRSANADARQASRESDALDRQRLAAAHRALDGEFGALRQRGARLHEFSNQLVSKKRIDAMLGASTGAGAVSSNSGGNANSSGNSVMTVTARAVSGGRPSNVGVSGASGASSAVATATARPPLTPRVSRGAS